MLHSTDYTWTISEAMYWSVIECSVGIIAACIPSFKALAKRYLPRLLGEHSSHTRYASNKDIEEGGNGVRGCLQKIDRYVESGREGTYATEESALKDWRRSGRSGGDEEREKDFVMGKGEMHTTVGLKTQSQESVNRMQVPDGKIVARTEIVRHVESM
jgi:hypothetical protein